MRKDERFMENMNNATKVVTGVNLPNIKKSALSQNSENNTSKVYTFSMRRSFVHVIGVFVVFIVSFLCISFPLGNYSETTSHASLLYDVVYEAPQIMKSKAKPCIHQQKHSQAGYNNICRQRR